MTGTGTKFEVHCFGEAVAARNVVDEIDFPSELLRAICFTAADQKIGEGFLGLRMAVASSPAPKTPGSVLGLRASATISLTSSPPPPVLSVVACKPLMTVLRKTAKVALFS